MMRYLDDESVERLRAEPWMIELLAMNPDYCSWGPGEDYMWKEGNGWNSQLTFPTWEDFGPWEMNDLNECVNFYFSVRRQSVRCEACHSGYNPETDEIYRSWHDHENLGGRWCDKIAQAELDALVESGRITGDISLDEVNTANLHRSLLGFGGKRGVIIHDSINRSICVKARAKDRGVYGMCPQCDGYQEVFTSDKAHVSLTLWWLHPRKGCSRGIEVERIEQSELSKVFAFLRQAADRNAERFAKIPEAVAS